jgi:hypothetical protein
LSTVKSRLKIENTEDFFEELNHKDQAVIDEALEQLENGKFISHDSVREEIKNRFNFSFDFIYPLFTSGKAGTNRTARIYARGIWTFQNKRDFLSI